LLIIGWKDSKILDPVGFKTYRIFQGKFHKFILNKSEAKTVGAYLKEVPEKRKPALKKIRQLCLELLPGYTESMAYNMPSYKREKEVEVAFGSQKQHISLYFLKHEVMLQNKNRLKGLNHGKGCIRFANPNKIDFQLITDLLQQTVVSDGDIC
jgi:uncharacterized protein YdhG (YjbR/CyaY superfamily)